MTSNYTQIINPEIGINSIQELESLIPGNEYIENVGVGIDSLTNNKTGTNNIAIGIEALNNNINGNHNIVIGSNASSSTSGYNNLILGHGANTTNNPTNNPKNQIAIGNGAVCPSDDTIYIGSTPDNQPFYNNIVLDIRMIPIYPDEQTAQQEISTKGTLYRTNGSVLHIIT